MAEQPSLSALHDHMDTLWASYLQHLDHYTKAQALIQKHMSAGYLYLARANFNARDGVTRYGKDFYHDRAVATKRVSVDADDSTGGRVRVTFTQWKAPVDDVDTIPVAGAPAETDSPESKEEQEKTQQPSPPTTPEPEVSSEKQPTSTEGQSNQTKPPLETDPIRWFGILVPRDLRSAKSSFELGLDSPIADALNAARSMRESETEIRKLRKEIRRMERS